MRLPDEWIKGAEAKLGLLHLQVTVDSMLTNDLLYSKQGQESITMDDIASSMLLDGFIGYLKKSLGFIGSDKKIKDAFYFISPTLVSKVFNSPNHTIATEEELREKMIEHIFPMAEKELHLFSGSKIIYDKRFDRNKIVIVLSQDRRALFRPRDISVPTLKELSKNVLSKLADNNLSKNDYDLYDSLSDFVDTISQSDIEAALIEIVKEDINKYYQPSIALNKFRQSYTIFNATYSNAGYWFSINL